MNAAISKAQIVLQLTPSDFNGYNVGCFGGNNGSINLSVTGGTAPFTFNWSNEATTEDISDLRAQYYSVLVTDANAITSEASITLTEPLEFSISLNAAEYILDGRRFNISCPTCFDGSITTTITNGIAPIDYLWENSNTTRNRTCLPEGNYKNIATDLNGCVSIKEIYLDAPERTDWQITGNSGTNPQSDYIGTTDNNDLIFKTNAIEQLRINSIGEVKIANFNSTNGSVYADEYGVLKIGIPPSPIAPCQPNQISIPMWYSKVVPPTIYTCPGISVGLGTDSPLEQFHVQGNAIFSQLNGGGYTSAPLIKGGNTFAQSTAATPDYTWYMNANTGIFHPELNTIAFSSSGVENMRIKETRVGIGTIAPIATLHVNTAANGADGSVVFTGPASPTFLIAPPITGAGTRMTWHPDFGAFRAGHVDNNQWDNPGHYSFAIGENNTADGDRSFAGGYGSSAGSAGVAGENSFAFGNNVVTNGANTFAVGSLTIAQGFAAFACGDQTDAIGSGSFASGMITTANGGASAAFGIGTIAGGQSSAAFGNGSVASGNESVAMGSSTEANGSNSMAIGSGTKAASREEFSIGRYSEITTGDPIQWVGTNPIFQIGITAPNTTSKNAMTVFKDGNVCIGTITPSTGFITVHDILTNTTGTYDGNLGWVTSSDSRLKSNIKPLESSLDKITKLEGVSFTWKENYESKKIIGFIAQDVEKLFPEAVVKDRAGNYLMAPQNLVAPVIEAIKEQQKQIKATDEEVKNLGSQMQQMNNLIDSDKILKNSIEQLQTEIANLKEQNIILNEKITDCCSQSENKQNSDLFYNSELTENSQSENLIPSNKIINIIPNPFNNFTIIKFHLIPSIYSAVLIIQNADGKTVDSKIIEEYTDGQYIFDGTQLDSGIYFCSLWVDGKKCDTRLLVLTK